MSPKVDNLYILDLYRDSWSVGRVMCPYCFVWAFRMWPSDTGYAWCEDCLKFINVEEDS